MPFFASQRTEKLWSCRGMCGALRCLLNNMFVRFGSRFYRQVVGVLMGTGCAPLVAGLFFVFLCGGGLCVVSVRQ